MLAAAQGTVPRSENIGLNTPVVLFAVAVSVAVAGLFGIFPALKSSRADVQGVLKEGGRGLVRGHQRMQHVLVVVQIALALVLLTGGGIIPEEDIKALNEMGAGKLFAPGATTSDIAEYIKNWVIG